MKNYAEIQKLNKIKVQNFEVEPFEGLYLGTKAGEHGDNYLFYSKDKYFEVFGTKSLHDSLPQLILGSQVRITYLEEVFMGEDRSFHKLKVESKPSELKDGEISYHLSCIGM